MGDRVGEGQDHLSSRDDLDLLVFELIDVEEPRLAAYEDDRFFAVDKKELNFSWHLFVILKVTVAPVEDPELVGDIAID